MIGLNVGSGQRPFDQAQGWINVDKVHHEGMPKPDVIADGASLPFESDSVDYVVLHHVWEHAGCGENDGMVRECHRVLKLGGSLIVTIPDLRELAMGWLTERISTQIYLTNLYGAYIGHEEDRHHWGGDIAYLLASLRVCAPWTNVTPFDWRPIAGSSIARDWWIAGAECVK